jgi:hypothetical protein
MAAVYARLVIEVEGDKAAAIDLQRFDSTLPQFEEDLDTLLFSIVNTWKLHGLEPEHAFGISRDMSLLVADCIEKMEASNEHE